jgi:hypothetical protein
MQRNVGDVQIDLAQYKWWYKNYFGNPGGFDSPVGVSDDSDLSLEARTMLSFALISICLSRRIFSTDQDVS